MKARTLGLLFLGLVMLAGAQPASAALNAYLSLRGESSGQVKGSVVQKGREGTIMVIAYSHAVTAPVDAASGLPSGKIRHSPLVITKEVDKSSPILHAMLQNLEKMKEFKLMFYQPSATGQEVQNFTITLTNARIISIKSEMMNNKYPENMQHKEREEISFVYDKITWTWNDGGITSTAQW